MKYNMGECDTKRLKYKTHKKHKHSVQEHESTLVHNAR